MAEICREHGARFLGVIGVSASQVEPERGARDLAESGCDPVAHDLAIANARLSQAVEARGLDVLDLLPAFRAGAAREHLYFRTDGHWNAAGHRVAAAALCRALRGVLSSTAVHPEGVR